MEQEWLKLEDKLKALDRKHKQVERKRDKLKRMQEADLIMKLQYSKVGSIMASAQKVLKKLCPQENENNL